MMPLSSGLLAFEEALVALEFSVLAFFVDLQASNAQVTNAKMQTRLKWFFIFPFGTACFCFSNPVTAVFANQENPARGFSRDPLRYDFPHVLMRRRETNRRNGKR